MSEMTPAKLRRALHIMFQLDITIGILVAILIKYETAKIKPWGWKISWWAWQVFLLCSCFLVGFSSQRHLIVSQNGLTWIKKEPYWRKLGGTKPEDEEFEDLVQASEKANEVKKAVKNILEKRNHPPQLVIATLITFYQQITGIIAIKFYAPVLFTSTEVGRSASLFYAIITCAVNVVVYPYCGQMGTKSFVS
ncbi:hypothetical protein O6H91_17G007800 [Diphasiastrum complanatum]|uniref:Uncharacterized protein n=1 Tax=Diphasiastrum complanatum TaxID=34168 RepID=A0ACC2B409_DIPCM|nr:hypothetical protein O6H91_17G007800 [Diphasiastrum complanatum]